MNGRAFIAGLVGALAVATVGLSQPAEAAQARMLDPVRAQALDQLDVEYARHTREHRMWEIQQRTDAQRARGRGNAFGRGDGFGRGYSNGRGYGRGDDYGRRGYGPGPGYGYGPGPGYRRDWRY